MTILPSGLKSLLFQSRRPSQLFESLLIECYAFLAPWAASLQQGETVRISTDAGSTLYATSWELKSPRPPHHPQCDGLLKRGNHYNHPFDWDDQLQKFCISYNTSINASTGYNPFLMFGHSEVACWPGVWYKCRPNPSSDHVLATECALKKPVTWLGRSLMQPIVSRNHTTTKRYMASHLW